MPAGRTVDVAVVGGGVIGLSVARELRGAGVPDVVVLERLEVVGRGSSSRGNGGVRAQFTTRPNIEFSRYSITEFERLGSSAGGFSFHQVGYLLFTGVQATAEALRKACDLQRSVGVATEWLSPEEVLERAPFLRPDGLLAGTFHSRDGLVDPDELVSVLERDVRERGAVVMTGAAVTEIRPDADGFLIVTGRGDVRAAWVVNAAGAEAARVAGLLGVDLPVFPVRRNLARIEGPPGPAIPMCVDLDTGILVRRHPQGGFVVGYSDADDPPSWDTTVDPRFLGQVVERIGNRFPLLEGPAIDPDRCWAGLYPETPDHHAIVGEFPEVPRFVQCAGFGGHGLMHSPAAGRAVAELVVEGECTTFDLRPLRPGRFAEGDLVAETAVF